MSPADRVRRLPAPLFPLLLGALLLAGCAAGTRGASDRAAAAPPRVLVVLSSHGELGDTGRPTGWFLAEAAHPWKVFRDAGYAVDFASPEGGAPPIDPKSMNVDDDPVNAAFMRDPAVQAAITTTPRLADVDAAGYDGIWLAGGHGTMWDFRGDADLARLVRDTWTAGGTVGAVCHGPAGLLDVEIPGEGLLVDGRRMTAFSDAEERIVALEDVVPYLLETELREQGADFHFAREPFDPHVEVDGRLVTGQNPASAEPAAERMVRVIGLVRSGARVDRD